MTCLWGFLKAVWILLLIGALFVPIVGGCAIPRNLSGSIDVEISEGEKEGPKKDDGGE